MQTQVSVLKLVFNNSNLFFLINNFLAPWTKLAVMSLCPLCYTMVRLMPITWLTHCPHCCFPLKKNQWSDNGHYNYKLPVVHMCVLHAAVGPTAESQHRATGVTFNFQCGESQESSPTRRRWRIPSQNRKKKLLFGNVLSLNSVITWGKRSCFLTDTL